MKITKKTVYLTLAIVLVLIQAFFTVRDGTILGIHVFKKAEPAVSQNKANDKPSVACDKVTATKAESILGTSVERIGGIFADRNEPTFISLCTYRSKQKPSRSVTIVLRDSKNEAAAKTTFAEIAKRKGSSSVSDLGDEAVFLATSQQITVRKGKRITTVSVNKPTKSSSISSSDAAQQIARETL